MNDCCFFQHKNQAQTHESQVQSKSIDFLHARGNSVIQKWIPGMQEIYAIFI